ncbi:UNVERIFIED_CONTAM: hypothetical protein HDU68_002416 [Siphonaria sp. JEL0065]|nr:hypothetical protein HDU68_002416 [Siphonaria sp. JEL0065]
MVLELGVDKRTPMGEYIVEKGGVPLSSQANPSPGPLTYDPKLPPSGFQYSILGKHVTTKLEANPVGPGPSKYNVSENTVVFNDAPHWSLGMKLGEFLKGVSGTSRVSPGSTRKSRVAADSRSTSKPSSQESTSSPQVAVKGPRGVNNVAAKTINKRMVLELGVDKRTPMGEYIVEKGGVPLSSQGKRVQLKQAI